MKIRSGGVVFDVSGELSFTWSAAGESYGFTASDPNYYIHTVDADAFILVDQLGVYFFSAHTRTLRTVYRPRHQLSWTVHGSDLYVIDDVVVLALSDRGTITWQYWHHDSIDAVEPEETGRYLRVCSTDGDSVVDKTAGELVVGE